MNSMERRLVKHIIHVLTGAIGDAVYEARELLEILLEGDEDE